MAGAVKFTATKLLGTGKRGILTPDADGYYEMIIGGLNTFNSVGEYYTLDGAKALFEQSSIFMRRIKNGCLKGEVDHPKRSNGMTDNDYISRILTIDGNNVCVHFKEIWLDENYGKKHPELKNSNLVAIMAKLKPAGPKGSALKASLDNADENVCFSIRALTKDYYQRGQVYRVLNQIVCFDMVTEPGISIANKWQAPALESLFDLSVTKTQLESIVEDRCSLVATEDSRQLAVESLKTFSSSVVVPKFTSW